jgi:hypothetical protein
MEELLDVRVVGHRPCADGSDAFDIDLEGHRWADDNNHGGTVAPDVSGYRISVWSSTGGSVDGIPAGECRDIAGLFRDRPDIWPPGPPLILLGCRPGLTGALEAELAHVRVDGTVHTMGWEHRVFGRVTATRPSTLGHHLVDVTLNAWIPGPLPAADRDLWDVWRAGGATEPNQWANLDRSGRYRWVRAAALHRSHAPDKPAGTVYHLDGRHITDYDGFYNRSSVCGSSTRSGTLADQ